MKNPLGFVMCTYDCDPRQTFKRMTPKRKTAIIEAVQRRAMTRDEALSIHALSEEEFEEWRARFSQYGVRGLGTTKQPWLDE